VSREGQTFVFVQRSDSRFERRPVRIGRKNDLYAEILSGLKAGELAAVAGAEALAAAHAAVR
jgi:multidrug efflux pump subunit AcrA (membrane-fusion protein)